MKLRAIVGKHVPAHPGTIFEKKFGIHVNREYRDSRICNNYYAVSVNQALQNSVNFNLKNLLRDMDAYSMAYSVESRQPFMDYRLILFLNSVPSCFKLRNGWTKFLARVAFDDKLPAEIVWRNDKMGWPRPLKEWLSDKIGNQVVDTIKKSILLKELIGDISNEDLGILMQTGNRSIFRLFNLARHYEIFFNNERVRYIKHE
jgi:asparagine synthase (glutamine-hydrolysing)